MDSVGDPKPPRQVSPRGADRAIEHMSQSPGRVRLRPLDGRVMDARLVERRQDPTGARTYVVAAEVPAAAVRPVAGESYDLVPTWRLWILHTRWMHLPGTLP